MVGVTGSIPVAPTIAVGGPPAAEARRGLSRLQRGVRHFSYPAEGAGPLTPAEEALIPKDLSAPYPGEVHVVARAGSVVIINSYIWHAGTTKRNTARQRVLHLTYTRRDLPQQLVQRDYLTPRLYDRMNPAQRFLMDIEEREEGAPELRSPSAPARAGGIEPRRSVGRMGGPGSVGSSCRGGVPSVLLLASLV
jgi:hypothetical protein